MKKQFYQIAIEFGIPFVGGILGLGGFFGSFVYAKELIDLRTALIISFIFICCAVFLYFQIKNHTFQWVSGTGIEYKISKISRKLILTFSGGIFLLWSPIIFDFKNKHKEELHHINILLTDENGNKILDGIDKLEIKLSDGTTYPFADIKNAIAFNVSSHSDLETPVSIFMVSDYWTFTGGINTTSINIEPDIKLKLLKNPACNIISGKTTDENNMPVGNVEIRVENLGAKTDHEGNFILDISKLPFQKRYAVYPSKPGYKIEPYYINPCIENHLLIKLKK